MIRMINSIKAELDPVVNTANERIKALSMKMPYLGGVHSAGFGFAEVSGRSSP